MMKKKTALLVLVAIAMVVILAVMCYILLCATRNVDTPSIEEETVTAQESVPEQAEEDEDVPVYMSEDYEKETRSSFEYNVDMGDVDLYSLPMDVPYLVTTDSHDGADGYINILYIKVAYALSVYYNGNVPYTFMYTEAEDAESIGDTSSIYKVHLHGDKEVVVSINSFDDVAMIEELN